MAREYLGCCPYDARHFGAYAGRSPLRLDSSCTGSRKELCYNYIVNPLDQDQGDVNPGSRGGYWFAGGGITSMQNRDAYVTPGVWKDYISYNWLGRIWSVAGGGPGAKCDFITSHYLGNLAPAGNVRLDLVISVAAASYQVQLSCNVGGVWTPWGAISGLYGTILGADPYVWHTLQIEQGVGPNPRARYLRDGVVIIPWQINAAIAPAAMSGTLSEGGGTIAKTGAATFHGAGNLVYHDDDIGPISPEPSLPAGDNIWSLYPIDDAPGFPSTWEYVGYYCLDNQKFRMVDDPEDADNQQNDWIMDPLTAGNQDQFFGFPTFNAGTVEAVSLTYPTSLMTGGGTPDPNYDGILDRGLGTVLTDTGLHMVIDGIGGDNVAVWHGVRNYNPAGVAWTRATFNLCKWGIRAVAGRTVNFKTRVHGVIVGVYGNGLGRRGLPQLVKAVACERFPEEEHRDLYPRRVPPEIVPYHHH